MLLMIRTYFFVKLQYFFFTVRAYTLIYVKVPVSKSFSIVLGSIV